MTLCLSSFQNIHFSIFGFFGSPQFQFIIYKYLLTIYYRPSTGIRARGKLRAKADVIFALIQFKIYWKTQT